MLLVAKNIISDSNLFFYLYNFSQSTTFEYNSENIDFRLNIAYKNQNNDFKERCKAFFEEKLNTWTDFTNLSARRKLYNNFSDWIEDEQQKEILEELEKSVKLIDEVEENLK